MEFIHDSSGAYLIVFALSLPVLIGLIGLGTDYGLWTYKQQKMQSATDAAAVSGAAAYTSSGDGPVVSQVNAITASYGLINGQNDVVISTHRPPTQGSYAGNNSAIEVVAQQPMDLLFSVLWQQAFVVTTRSVAMANAANGCVLALDQTASAAASAQGSTSVTLKNCSLISNSASATAVNVGGSALIQALSVGAVGGISGLGGIKADEGTATGIWPVTDPYADVQIPTYSGCTTNGKQNIKGKTTLSPGVYCGDITVNAGAVLNLNPGIYILDRASLKVNGGATLIGHGVTIIFTSSTGSNYGTASINGGAILDLTPPVTGNTAGIVIYGDRNMPVGTAFSFNGGATQSLAGSIYLPKAAVSYSGGNTATSACIKIIADTITFTGNSNLSIDCSAYPTRAVGGAAGKLVE
ncbi:TadE/TadG family type IV pilus assembly protein [Rhizobium mayense]|uniref:Pilus assembly protein TadG-related protein n=1 Tax=Rhizobium mayense TaxID=1312184 RepID=A0ABT7JPY9_9HYPH|nr:pilus assembly protein TadG-related protein [Rhizobium mayense]MDL2398409.1 pilus assembly protein TadG-related protein [Rhizobium mayense]